VGGASGYDSPGIFPGGVTMPTQPTRGCRKLTVDVPDHLADQLDAATRPAVPGGPHKTEVVRLALERYFRRQPRAQTPGHAAANSPGNGS
jgi:hypothetical protein